ncbi:MAG: DUF5678 domain-containing protein [Acidobacteriota bacterium]
MSSEQLDALKEQLAQLPAQEKLELARFLFEQAESNLSGGAQKSDALKREQHMVWLKAHREEYAGQYVALDGDRLVGSGATIREAHQQAREQGVEHPFLVHVSSANDAPFGGW